MFNTFRKIIILCDNFKKYLYLLIFFNSFSIIVEMISIGLLIPIGTFLFFPELFNNNEFFLLLTNFINISDPTEQFYVLILLLIGAYLFKFIYFVFLSWIENLITNKIQFNLSQNLFRIFLNYKYEKFKNFKTSEINNTIFNESEIFHASLSNLIILISEILLIISVVGFLLFINPFLVLSIISIFLIGSFLFIILILSKIKKLGSIRLQNAKLSIDNILNTFSAFIDIKIIDTSKFFHEKYIQTYSKFINSNRLHGTLLRFPRIWIEFLLVTTFVFIFIYVKNYVNDIDNFFPLFSFMIVFSIRMLPSFNRILSSYQTIKYNSVSIDNLSSKMIFDETNQKRLETTKDFDEIIFDNVSFNYSNNKNNIFENLNYIFKKNNIIGIKGRSGKGKTTLLLLLLGLLKPNSGLIYINNKQNINIYSDWINKFGYVSQETILIDDTIRNNILFGKFEKSFNREKYNSSINYSLLTEIIKSKGENDIIDGKKNKLSSGQSQRVHLARALYHSKDILILDEATNNLDRDNEKKFLQNLDEIKKNKIVVFVTHSNYVLSFCDEIINLDNM